MSTMSLEEFGYDQHLEAHRKSNQLDSFLVGRVISEHKERYIVKTQKGDFEAEIVGNLRFSANSRLDFPAIGDWVAISEYDEGKALIHAIYPRKTIIERQAVGKFAEKQIIATNIDYAFIVQAVDRDFNINRIERYLTICHASKVNPIILFNKIDLIEDAQLDALIKMTQARIDQVPIIAISNENRKGYDALLPLILKGKTYCLLGSSGVGKSSLLNNLSGSKIMETNAIGKSTNRGKHVTTHRQMILLENGGILIDNPGMREVGIADASAGLEITFDTIQQLSQQCKFKDCKHIQEKGCAVLKAVENGEIDEDSYQNFLKMEKEQSHFEMTLVEKRKKDKNFGKMVKNMKKHHRKY